MSVSSKTKQNYEMYISLYESGDFNFAGSDYGWIYNLSADDGLSALRCFDLYDNRGIREKCAFSEIEELVKAIVGKASLNFHIKLWSDSIASGLLLIDELQHSYGERLPGWVYDKLMAVAAKPSYGGHALLRSHQFRNDFMKRFHEHCKHEMPQSIQKGESK